MATLVTQAEIKKLYKSPEGQDGVVAFGRAIPIKPVKRAKSRKLQDLEFGSKAYDEEYNRMTKTSSKAASPVLASEVVELI